MFNIFKKEKIIESKSITGIKYIRNKNIPDNSELFDLILFCNTSIDGHKIGIDLTEDQYRSLPSNLKVFFDKKEEIIKK